jgi:hypothetical protein
MVSSTEAARHKPALYATTLVIAGLFFTACATAPPPQRTERVPLAEAERPERAEGEISAVQERVAAAALSFVGQNPEKLYVGDREFRCDCTGVVLASYYKAGIDLLPAFSKERGNGVARLHGMAARYDLMVPPSYPQPGDVIIWDDTYDRNGDGAWGDPFTHTGIVVHVYPDGQIEYVHHNYRRGVVVAYMNLHELDTYQVQKGNQTLTVNSAMRMKSHRYIRPEMWLSSHLFRNYARLTELPAEAR